MLSFDDTLKEDHLNMLSSDEFGVSCLNKRTNETFDVIKTDAFVEVTADGSAIIEEKPMFNTSKANDIKQFDIITISFKDYIVRDVKSDGIDGIDVYLKV